MMASSASGPLSKSPSIAASVTGWCFVTIFPWPSPVGNATRMLDASPATTPARRQIAA